MEIMLRKGVSLFGGDNEYKGRMKTKFTYLFGLVLIIFNSSYCTNKFVSASYTNRIECKEELGFSIYDLSIDILEFQNGKKWLDTSSFSINIIFKYGSTIYNDDTLFAPKYAGLMWPINTKDSQTLQKFIDSIKFDKKALDYVGCAMAKSYYWHAIKDQPFWVTIENAKGKLHKRKRKINPLMYDALKNRKKKVVL